MPKLMFNPKADIPSLTGKVILITGGTSGLGYETVLSFAAHEPAHIYFTGRSQASADKLLKEVQQKHAGIPMTFISVDQTSLQSVKHAAQTFLEKSDRLDILYANAGVMALPPGLTKEGYEIQFGTNHVAHALLAKLLTPIMEATAQKGNDVRVIWLSSVAYEMPPKKGIQFDGLRTTQKNLATVAAHWARYGQSKLANLLYAREFAKHHPSLTSVSVHPGISATNIVSSLGFVDRMLVRVMTVNRMIPPEQCAWNQQWAGTAPLGSGPKQVQSGKYYEPVGIATKPKGDGSDDALAGELWDWTQKELQEYTL